MITVTLQFNTGEEALAALKKLEGTAADPVNSLGKPVAEGSLAATLRTAGPDTGSASVKSIQELPKDGGASQNPPEISFQNDIGPAFLALAKLSDGGAKQKAVVDHFGVARLSMVDKSRYQEVLDKIKELAA